MVESFIVRSMASVNVKNTDNTFQYARLLGEEKGVYKLKLLTETREVTSAKQFWQKLGPLDPGSVPEYKTPIERERIVFAKLDRLEAMLVDMVLKLNQMSQQLWAVEQVLDIKRHKEKG